MIGGLVCLGDFVAVWCWALDHMITAVNGIKLTSGLV